MNNIKINFILLLFLSLLSINVFSQNLELNQYHSPKQVKEIFTTLNKQNSGTTKIHSLATTPGGNEIIIFEIGKEVKSENKKMPAIFVAANMDGGFPISTEAALFLAQTILQQEINNTWYILAVGNPDAADYFFNSPLLQNVRNKSSYNDDMDENIDEDGYEDLNKDGYITYSGDVQVLINHWPASPQPGYQPGCLDCGACTPCTPRT